MFDFIRKMNWLHGGKFLERSLWKLISCFLERILGSLYFHFLTLKSLCVLFLILKSSFLSWSTLRGFCFWKINILGILKHAHFVEIELFVIFGHIWSYLVRISARYHQNIILEMLDMWPRGTRDHLRPKRLILYCNLQHIWKKRPIRCRVVTVTCTK